MATPLTFLAVGDVTVDSIIRLKDATVHCDLNHEACTISMNWGDKIPYEFAVEVPAVGNAANAAISAARLGLSTGFLSSTGTDAAGESIVARLKENNVDTALVSQFDDIASSHYFVLWYESERTILVRHGAFPYHIPPEATPPPFVYLSSLGDDTGKAHAALLAWMAANPESKLIFQPGYELKMPRELMDPVYQAACLTVCNKEEAEGIVGMPAGSDIKDLFAAMHGKGPKTVIITDGPHGAYASDGTHVLSVPLYPDPAPPYERTGAGDAFASAVAAALALGKPLDEALLWGPVNSMSVVQKVGAQEGLLHRDELEQLLANAPADYKLTDLT